MMQTTDLPSLRGEPAAWKLQAACRAADPAVMVPDRPDQKRRGQRSYYARALALCAVCPVVEACREAGQGERFGVWGGTIPDERVGNKTRACQTCGASFHPNSGAQRYCGDHQPPQYRRKGAA